MWTTTATPHASWLPQSLGSYFDPLLDHCDQDDGLGDHDDGVGHDVGGLGQDDGGRCHDNCGGHDECLFPPSGMFWGLATWERFFLKETQ